MAGSPVKGLYVVPIRKAGQPIRWYVYAWRGGPCILKQVGGPRPVIDDAALQRLAEARAGRSVAKPHTVADMAAKWRATPQWKGMAASTRMQWGYKLAAIEAKWGAAPFAVFQNPAMRAKIIDWRDTLANSPRGADYAMQVLSAFLSWAVERGALKANPAAGIRQLYKGGGRAHIIWEAHEREAWKRAAEPVNVAFRFACLTGMRRGDLCRVTWEAVGLNAIVWQPAKARGEVVATIPMLPALRTLLASIRKEGATGPILRNEHGRPWTESGLTHAIARERERLGLPDKHLHDCRGTFATELCLAGLTDTEIAGILGWGAAKVATIRRVYVDQAATVVQIGARLAGVKQPVKTRV
jgi:integrase